MRLSRGGIFGRLISVFAVGATVADALRGAPADGPADPIDPTVRYEGSDLHARAVFLTGVGVLVGTGAIALLIYPYYSFLKQERAEKGGPMTAARVRNALPPEPRLQGNPRTDLKDFRGWEESQLHGYHWVDQQKQIVSIPIDDAITILAHRGIPPQPDPGGYTYFDPRAGSRITGFENKVEPEPR